MPLAEPMTVATAFALAALGVFLLLGLVFTFIRPRPLGPYLLLGMAVSLAGALVQARRIAPHPLFNHNDLFHVLEMGGLYLCYQAARAFPEEASPEA